jgi:methionine-gamma-lyase
MEFKGFTTKAVQTKLKTQPIHPKNMPIYQTSAFVFMDTEDLESYFEEEGGYMYSRYGNPNVDALAAVVANLESAEDGVAAASGMAAILAGILSCVSPGEEVICAEDIYGGTYGLLHKELTRLGIRARFVSFQDDEWVEEIHDNTRLLVLETLSNPTLLSVDLTKMVKIAKQHGLKVMIDNTFTTPYLIQPLQYGVDLVAHSATKYIGGHSDITAGVLVGKKDLIMRAREIIIHFGSTLSPFEAWLTTRGVKTLGIRMERQCRNAYEIAKRLEQHSQIREVHYPGLMSHPSHEICTRQLKGGYGAIVTFTLKDQDRVNEFMRGMKWIRFAPTLAGVETTFSHPASTSHRSVDPSIREKLRIGNGTIRLSVGIEEVEDIWEDLLLGLNALEN